MHLPTVQLRGQPAVFPSAMDLVLEKCVVSTPAGACGSRALDAAGYRCLASGLDQHVARWQCMRSGNSFADAAERPPSMAMGIQRFIMYNCLRSRGGGERDTPVSPGPSIVTFDKCGHAQLLYWSSHFCTHCWIASQHLGLPPRH